MGIGVLDVVSAKKPTSTTPISARRHGSNKMNIIFVSAEQADVASFARLAPIGTAEKREKQRERPQRGHERTSAPAGTYTCARQTRTENDESGARSICHLTSNPGLQDPDIATIGHAMMLALIVCLERRDILIPTYGSIIKAADLDPENSHFMWLVAPFP